jgi:hypothetical protein
VARKRQIVLMKARRGGDPSEMPPLGSAPEVIAALSNFNTAPDGGSGGSLGTMTLYGPGMMMLMPTTQKTITQLIANLTDEEIALPVLMRACKALGWAMMDMETGRTFGG